jgi:hypothetical protein
MAEIQPLSRDRLVVCACGGREYQARDAIDAALFRGELEPIWKEFLCKISAEAQAKELDLELDDNAVDEMAELFRYEHDLITAEETERWLEQRGLTLEDFSDYFALRYWRTAVENISPRDIDLTSAPVELRDLFTIELIVSGELDLLTKQLMWRLAAVAGNGEQGVDEMGIAAERQRFTERLKLKPSKVGTWLDQFGRDEAWLEQMLAMEAAYRRICETVLNPQSRNKQLALLRMSLMRFEAEAIEVESLDAAREALLCIREDDMSMEEVAAEARYPYRRITFRHEDIPSELQQKFWSVGAGDLLEPLPRGDGFELYRITKKSEPELSDPIVQERIDQRLLEQHFSHLVRDHVEPKLQAAGLSE